MDGSGSIAVHAGQANFHFSVTHGRKNKIVGSFSYSDPAAGLNINASKLSSLSINANHAQFSGMANHGRSFVVNVTDNGNPGTNDTFSISVSNGYSASGNLTSGNIAFH